MRGRVEKDKEGNLIVVYYKECVEDSEAVVQVYCRILPGFDALFKVGDNIEFELIEFAQEDGSFSSYAKPFLKLNSHIAKVIDNNEDGEADMADKLVAIGKTLRSQIYYRITNDGSPFGCGAAMRNAESIEELFDEYAIEFAEWVFIRDEYHAIEAGNITFKKLLEIFKKEKGL